MADMGKKFEEDFFKSFSPLINTSIDRLKDQTTGFKGDNHICDYIVFTMPNQFYLELKSYQTNTIPVKAVRPNQFEGLMNKASIRGVHAGVLLQYRCVTPHEHYFIPIEYWNHMKANDIKSISLQKAREIGTELKGTLLRTRYRYEKEDLENFFHFIKLEANKWKTNT